jgi:pimeloyl-ACP methyl ester carboxylesterase
MSGGNLLFVHGAGSQAGFWHEQQKAFPGALYVNLPGHGVGEYGNHTVSLPGQELGIEPYAEALARYIESSGLHDVILDGHSMGGAVALTLALRHPPWLRALVLTSTGARFRVPPDLLDLLRTDYPAAVERIVELCFVPVEGELSYAQRIARNGTRRKLLRTPQAVTLSDYESSACFDVTTRLDEIEVPTIIVVGSEDRMTGPDVSAELHAGIPSSRLCIIEAAGHMLPLERPGEYNDTVRRFADSIVISI